MIEFDRSRSGGRYFSESIRPCMRLWFSLFCAAICCTVIGCQTGFYMHGKVVDADGNPIADAKLVFSAKNDEFISSHRSSDADGSFTFEEITSSSVDVGVISISVEKNGYAPVKVRLALGNHYDDAEIVFATATAS